MGVTETNSNITRYAYVYKYDDRNRMIYKKLPGCDPIYYLYDKADKLMMSQDGSQRQRGVWTAYGYDIFERPLYSCEIPKNYTYDEAAYFHNNNIRICRYNPSNSTVGNTGYEMSWGVFSNIKVLSANYYDETIMPVGYNTAKQKEYGKVHSANGLLTTTANFVLNGTADEYYTTHYYYDYRGRMIVKEVNFGEPFHFERMYYKYDFTGNILKTETEYCVPGGISGIPPTVTLYYVKWIETLDYRYDHAGRILSIDFSFNDFENQHFANLVTYEYDALGRMIVKNQHNNLNNVEYDYNILGWLTNISDGNKFNQKISYNPNGNIWSLVSKYMGSTCTYIHEYDNLNRLTFGGLNIATGGISSYQEIFTYDKNGNILTLDRSLGFSLIDKLVYSYTGNQLTSITDQVITNSNEYGVKEYINRNTSSNDFAYDKNGNMIKDLDRNITSITYNVLNLPQTIQFTNGSTIKNKYLSDGTKIETEYETVLSNAAVPIGDLSNTSAGTMSVVSEKTTYFGNKEYRIEDNKRIPTRIFNSQGYWQDNDFYYYRKDYLGSNRETYKVSSGAPETIQEMNYYPSGLPWANAVGASEQNYKYVGLEFIEMHGYDAIDYNSRIYLPTSMRFTSPDPHAESYYHISPYAFCANNPVNYIDPDGQDVRIWYRNNNGEFSSYIYQGGSVRHSNAYVNQVINAINYNINNGGGDPSRAAVYNRDLMINIYEVDVQSNFLPGKNVVYWNSTLGGETDGIVRSPATVLDHELNHAVQFNLNKEQFWKDYNKTDLDYTNNEEKRVITGSEQKTAKANNEIKNGQVTRKGHKGNYVSTENETSTKVIENKTNETKNRINQHNSSWTSEF